MCSIAIIGTIMVNLMSGHLHFLWIFLSDGLYCPLNICAPYTYIHEVALTLKPPRSQLCHQNSSDLSKHGH